MNGRLAIFFIIIIFGLGGLFIYIRQHDKVTVVKANPVISPIPKIQTSSSVMPLPTIDKSINLVTNGINGFTPETVTIKVGDSVTWVNSDLKNHTVNSDPHPSHTAYPSLNTIGLLKPGEKKSLVFPTKGTYGYHDHLNPSHTGTIIVE